MGVFRQFTKLFSIIGRFRSDFPTGAVFGDFEPLNVDWNTSDTQKDTSLRQTTPFEPSYVKIRCELWSVGQLTKHEDEEKNGEKIMRNRGSVTVYFTHMGSCSRRIDCYQIWQFSSFDQRTHSLKIWY
jgi:hypothetical protein